MYDENKNKVLDWDSEIGADSGERVLLPEGDYVFEVTNFERGRFPGSAKMSPGPKAIYTLMIHTDKGDAFVTYDLILNSAMEWKISEFFRGLGMKAHGQQIRPDWEGAKGKKGKCRVKQRQYTTQNGDTRTVNDVDKIYDYDPADHKPARKTASKAKAPLQPPAPVQEPTFDEDDDLPF